MPGFRYDPNKGKFRSYRKPGSPILTVSTRDSGLSRSVPAVDFRPMESFSTHTTLLARLSEGCDQAAWREFYDRYGELIRSFARRRGLQPSDREDTLQDVMMSLTKAMPGFRYDPNKGKFRSYLKTITVRAIYKRTCQERGKVALEDIEGVVAKALTDDELERQWEQDWRLHHMRRALRRIEPEINKKELAAFEQYALAGRDARDTAAELGLSVEQVWQAKSRTLKRLGALIDEQVRDEG